MHKKHKSDLPASVAGDRCRSGNVNLSYVPGPVVGDHRWAGTAIPETYAVVSKHDLAMLESHVHVVRSEANEAALII